MAVQKAKSDMSTEIEESISNIKTAKAFAEERGHIRRVDKASWDVFEYGRSRAYFWAVFFFSQSCIGQGATVLLIFLLSKFFEDFEMTAGKATSVLLY